MGNTHFFLIVKNYGAGAHNMNKFYFITFLTVLFSTACTFASHESTLEYPFKDLPTLSWGQFEQNFRNQYSDIDIPPIHPNDLPGPRAASYCENGYIDYNPHNALSIADAQGVLLHEIGHHNYSKVLREQNHKKACQVVDAYEIQINKGLFITQIGLMLGNACHIFCKKPHFGLLAAQGITMGLLSSRYKIPRKILDATVCQAHRTLPEEYAADVFANNHGTAPTLQARNYGFSSEGLKKRMHEESETLKRRDIFCKNNGLRNPHNDELIFDPDKATSTIVITLYQKFPEVPLLLSQFLDYKHPTPQQRQALIAQALKDRFNITV